MQEKIDDIMDATDDGFPAEPPDNGSGAARDPVVDDAVPMASAATSGGSKNGSGAPSRRGSVVEGGGTSDSAAVQGVQGDDADDDFTGLMWWAGDGDLEEVKAVLAEYDADDLPLEAAMLVACQNGHTNVVKALLRDGADGGPTNRHGESGYTCLHFAASRGHEAIINLLVADGAVVDADIPDRVGNTPLHVAALAGRKNVIEALLRHQAHVNERCVVSVPS